MARCRIITVPLIAVLCLAFCSCAHRSSSGGGSASDGPRYELKYAGGGPPPEIKSIETVIDQGGVIKAETVEIYASANYEWDVSLTGDRVGVQQKIANDERMTVAHGEPRAMFRNLDIRAYDHIVFRKSALGVVPFIRITARGRAIYIRPGAEGAEPSVRRADQIVVENAELRFQGDGTAPPTLIGAPDLVPAGGPRPAGELRRD